MRYVRVLFLLVAIIVSLLLVEKSWSRYKESMDPTQPIIQIDFEKPLDTITVLSVYSIR